MAENKTNNQIVIVGGLLLIPLMGFFIWRMYFYFPYPTITPSRGVAISSVQAEGEVEAANWTPIYTQVTAEVKDIPVKIGQEVKAGDPLILLSDEKQMEELAELEDSVKSLVEEKDRIKEMMKATPALRSRYDRLVLDIEQAQTDITAQQAEVDKLKIVAPVDGVFLKTTAVVGKLASPGNPVAWVGQPKPLRVAMTLDEEQSKGAIIGQKVLLHLGDQEHRQGAAALLSSPSGTLAELLPLKIGDKNMTKARASLPDGVDLPIATKLPVELVIDQKQDAILLPPTAVKNNTVLVVKFAEVTPVPVMVGATSSDSVEIKVGLYGDEKVIPDIDKFMPPAPAPAPAVAQ